MGQEATTQEMVLFAVIVLVAAYLTYRWMRTDPKWD